MDGLSSWCSPKYNQPQICQKPQPYKSNSNIKFVTLTLPVAMNSLLYMLHTKSVSSPAVRLPLSYAKQYMVYLVFTHQWSATLGYNPLGMSDTSSVDIKDNTLVARHLEHVYVGCLVWLICAVDLSKASTVEGLQASDSSPTF